MTQSYKEECEVCHDWFRASELHFCYDQDADVEWVECAACETKREKREAAK